MEILTVQADFTALDALLFRRYRREVPGLVERTYDLNPGLADFGPWLPVGAKIIVEPPEPTPARARPVVSLYD